MSSEEPENAAKMDGAVAVQTRPHLGSSSMRCESSWNITKCGRAMFIIHQNYRYVLSILAECRSYNRSVLSSWIYLE